MLTFAGARRQRKADGAALAAAGQNGFGRSPSCSLHPPLGFLQHRQRVAAGKDEIADAGRAQRGLLLAGPSCQIDMLGAGGLKGLCGGGRVFRIDLVGGAQAGDRRA